MTETIFRSVAHYCTISRVALLTKQHCRIASLWSDLVLSTTHGCDGFGKTARRRFMLSYNHFWAIWISRPRMHSRSSVVLPRFVPAGPVCHNPHEPPFVLLGRRSVVVQCLILGEDQIHSHRRPVAFAHKCGGDERYQSGTSQGRSLAPPPPRFSGDRVRVALDLGFGFSAHITLEHIARRRER